MVSSESLRSVHELGQKLLALAPEQSDEFVAGIEHYVTELDLLIGGNRLAELSGTERQLLAEVLETHAEIVKVADKRKGETGQFLTSLQSRGRGLRAYVDPLPKRISVRKPREG